MTKNILIGDVLDEHTTLSLGELCQACSSHAEWIITLVEEGILDPIGTSKGQWQFSSTCLQRAQTARRLQRDLDINLAGIALALNLLDEIDYLRARLNRLEPGS